MNERFEISREDLIKYNYLTLEELHDISELLLYQLTCNMENSNTEACQKAKNKLKLIYRIIKNKKEINSKETNITR